MNSPQCNETRLRGLMHESAQADFVFLRRIHSLQKKPIWIGTYQNLTRISGTASDTGDSSLNRVRVLLYRQASSRAPAGYYAGGSNWNGNDQTYRETTLYSNGTWKQDLPSIEQGFVPGTYVAKAIAVDDAENRSQPFGVVFTMLAPPDTTPPSVDIIAHPSAMS